MNNTVNKLILDRESCEKLHKKLRFADPVIITSDIQIAYNDIKWEENKAFWSKTIKSLLEQKGLGDLWMKAHCGDIRMVNIRATT